MKAQRSVLVAHYAGLALLGGLSLAAAESLAIPLPANFVIRGNLEFSGRTASPAHLEFQTGSNCIVRISLARDQVILEAEQPPQKTHLGAARLASPRPKKCTFTVCRDGEALAFLSPGYATGRWRLPGPEAPETLPTPEVGTRPAEEETWNLIVREGAGVRIADLRLQPTTPVEFSDDFMRSDEGSGTWNPLRGLWALDEIPYPTWSASPFRLKGTGPGVALTTSGFWFWHDYAMRCAVRPGGDSLGCGIALYAQGPSDMILFRWKRRNPREEDEPRHVQGALELLLVHDGEERLLASQEAWLDPSQWYELAAGVCEGQVCAFVDGIRLFQVSCPEATLGGIGLWALDGALFDDVEAKSFSPGLLAAPKNDPDEFLERLFGHRRVVVGERFARDALMQEWANAQGEWVSRPDPRGQLLWHIGLFGPRVRLRWDCSWKPGAIPDPVLWAMTTDGRDLSSGYLLRLGPETLLLRGDRTLGRGTLPAQIESLEWTRQDGRHTLRANGQTVLSAEDAEPAGAGKVGLLLPGTSGLILDAGRLTADSPACHDTTFGTAPVDWRAAAGVWDITSRWICTPKWSWFGGLSHEAAVIWSKRAFLGDQVIDLHSAVMMDFGAAGGYRRLGDINLSFCADGASLGSGYTLMYGGFNNTRTCLWRQGEVVAERSDRLYPDKSRGAHKNWYNLRAEKMGPSVRFYLADELILEYRDPQPLPGGHVALWTWDGGMMIPRVRIYAESEMTPPRETLFAAPDASPGSADEYRSREARIRDETGRACLRFVNPQSGGDFSSALPIGEFDALKTGVLSFDYRIPAEARLHLYLEANGRDFYVALNGPETPSEHAIRQATEVSGRRINVSALTGRVRRPARLASLPISADDCWHHAEIELADLLRPFFPRASAIRVRGVHLANWCNADYLMCGLTGNPAGCTLFLDDVRCRRGASAAVAGAAGAAAAPEPSDSYEADSGLWYPAEESPPFKMFLDAAPERERERALRIEAGALGFKAVLLDRRFDIRRHPTLCLDYRAEQPLGLSLAVRVGGQWQPLAAASALGLALDGQWHSAQINLSNWLARRNAARLPIIEAIGLAATPKESPEETALWVDNLSLPAQAFPADTAPPSIVARTPGPEADAAAQTIQFEIRDEDSGPDLASLRIEVEGRVFDLSHPDATYKPLAGKEALRGGIFSVLLRQPPVDRKKIRCGIQARDRAGHDLPAPEEWTWTMDYRQDGQPPPAPFVSYLPSRRMTWDDFENTMGEWSSRSGAVMERTTASAATGLHSLEVRSGSAFAVYTPFDASKFPVVRFDYCLKPGASFDWLVRIDNTNWQIRCGPGRPRADVLSVVPGIVSDGQWHRAEFDLLACLEKRPDPGVDFIVEHLATQHRGNAGCWLDNFTLSARGETEPLFQWSRPVDATGIRGYSFVLDESADTLPDEVLDTKETSHAFKGLKPGSHVLHVRACDGAGNWGPAGHAQVEVVRN